MNKGKKKEEGDEQLCSTKQKILTTIEPSA